MIDISKAKKSKRVRRIMRVLFPWKSIHNGLYEAYAKYHKRAKVGIKNEYFSHKIYKKYHCHVSPLADIGEGTIFPHPIGIVIGRWAKIGKDCVIYQNVTIGRRNPSDEYDLAEIGDNVLVGCNSIILGKVKIGSDAKIAAGSIVLRDVKPGETVHGVVK